MDKDPCSHDVSEEIVAEAMPFGCAFDQPRNICQNKGAIHVGLDEAKIRELGRKRIVGDFGPSAR